MSDDLGLRRKWTFRAGDQKVVFVKHANERAEHVWMKAFLWALYMPQYPDISVEIRIGDRYRPDVVAFGDEDTPVFWGEAGRVGNAKIRSLARRFPATHIAIAKWDSSLAPYIGLVKDATKGLRRTAPFDLLSFADDSADRLIQDDGWIQISFDEVKWVRLE